MSPLPKQQYIHFIVGCWKLDAKRARRPMQLQIKKKPTTNSCNDNELCSMGFFRITHTYTHAGCLFLCHPTMALLKLRSFELERIDIFSSHCMCARAVIANWIHVWITKLTKEEKKYWLWGRCDKYMCYSKQNVDMLPGMNNVCGLYPNANIPRKAEKLFLPVKS